MKNTLLCHCPEAARHCGAQRRSSLPRSGPSLCGSAALVLALALVSARAETVAIANAADWASFASRVNAGETTLCAEMTADVTLGPDAPRVGTTESTAWRGEFDGGGHTLRVNWTFSGTAYAAPFAITAGCTIHNLCIAGSIVTDTKYAGGFIGWARPGNVLFERCRSSVSLTITVAGEACCGGFLGRTYWAISSITFRDCVFDGSILGTDATDCGGFAVNSFQDPKLYFYRCLFDPGAISVSSTGSKTFAPSYLDDHVFITGSGYSGYYTRTLGAAQGTAASGMSVDDLVAALGSNWTNVNGRAALALFPNPPVEPEPAVFGFAYQGALRDAQGNALQALEHTVEFRLYGQAAGGEPLWGRSHAVTLDTNGLFNVALSDESGDAIEGVVSNGLASALAANSGSPLYLGLTVAGSGAEISPRQKILAVPFATYATDASTASGDLAVAGAVTAATANVAGETDVPAASIGGAVSAGSISSAGGTTIGGDLSVDNAIFGFGEFPLGAIVLWSGSSDNIPDGWALCNGNTVNDRKTPDLRDRFVPGAGGGYTVGTTGGEATHKLTVAEMPSHKHTYSFKGADLDLSWVNHNYFYSQFEQYSGNGRDGYTDYTGGDKPHENRPPYYALCYIMRVR